MTAHVWRTGQQMFLTDAADHPLVSPALLALDEAVSVLWQPVIVQGAVVAMLNVTWRRRIADPGDRAVRVVRLIANEAGYSLHATRLRRELERSATTDPLTGSLNRRAWDAELALLMDRARLSGNPLTVALVDLDHFKYYNDANGHTAGDVLLTQFAGRARTCLRKHDVFGRWGGEEFIVALYDCTPEHAKQILERIRSSVPSGGTCSIGHTMWDGTEPLAASIARADTALYVAKRNGRDRVVGQ
jgi:diguanylate cyclase (GGDEF)-like protein